MIRFANDIRRYTKVFGLIDWLIELTETALTADQSSNQLTKAARRQTSSWWRRLQSGLRVFCAGSRYHWECPWTTSSGHGSCCSAMTCPRSTSTSPSPPHEERSVNSNKTRKPSWRKGKRETAVRVRRLLAKKSTANQTTCDFLSMVNSNRGRITYGLRDIFGCRGWKSPFSPTVQYCDCTPLAEKLPAISM